MFDGLLRLNLGTETNPNVRLVRWALLLSLLTTALLCAYLVVVFANTDAFGSERLYWEYSGRVLGKDWTLGYNEWIHNRIGDLPSLPDAAGANGQEAPYSDFVLEYPPGAMIYFTAVPLVANDFQTFSTVHHVLMAASFLAAVWASLASLRLCGPSTIGFVAAAMSAPVLLYLVGGIMVVSRFDALAAVCVAVGICQAMRGRLDTAALLIGLGASIKIWPIFLLPFLLPPGSVATQMRVFGRMALVAVGIFALAHIFWIPFGSQARDLLGYLEFASQRPPHSESMIVLLSSVLGYMDASQATFSFGSHNREFGSLLATSVELRLAFLLLSGVMVLAIVFYASKNLARGELLRLQASLRLSVVALLLCTSMFFSGEYMIWLVPLVLAVSGSWQGITLATTFVAMAGVKASYIRYDDALAMNATGQAVGAVKWGAISALALLGILALLLAFRRSRRNISG